jgi:hypothetical protein
MAKRPRLMRLSKSDYEGLVLAHDKCARAIGLLSHTNWGGAPGTSALVEDVDRFLCQLYNRAEGSLRKSLGLDPIETPQDAPPELGAAEIADHAANVEPGEEPK